MSVRPDGQNSGIEANIETNNFRLIEPTETFLLYWVLIIPFSNFLIGIRLISCLESWLNIHICYCPSMRYRTCISWFFIGWRYDCKVWEKRFSFHCVASLTSPQKRYPLIAALMGRGRNRKRTNRLCWTQSFSVSPLLDPATNSRYTNSASE